MLTKELILEILEKELQLKSCHEDSIPELVKIIKPASIPPSNGADYRRVTYVDERSILSAATALLEAAAVKWISIKTELPPFGLLCDIWVSDEKEVPRYRREIYYVFVEGVGVTNKPAFQQEYCNKCGLYELAYFLDENLITHWMPSPSDPPQL